ncbi:hypothetical protein [Mycolicibacterium diernhoferi]|uniref:Uncharacterized protein n=1 Tax=Mycolicibacterium diernhoferi TaxID=1801 RepID=A0A1Q4HL35_9MYCO|nr:hypothetical protein [Mycolicibacterium diernhoferi]OJZ68195.1 hypothetical protein BRW64_00950 [Mycolicibacterium diernhoferi]OPE48496.1 hypothetical protein BV510_23640 [Mycolicibacterium diernhoferi]PEG56245.1 hypothetical protein CRI78_02435 [Mycolicibacterium diernhoferi]QYL21316.1 hypothetical protein K0O62_20120 [Mycolicibacterium diernhoferi]
MKFHDIASEIRANVVALHQEVVAMAEFLDGREHNFRHATFGYAMACMGQIDVMSYCTDGPDKARGAQTRRMQRFMERYIDQDKSETHRVAIQLMRHTLMHTGAFRYPYDETNEIAYTWQCYFNDSDASKREHYSLTVENPLYQEHLLEASQGRPVAQIKALNFRLILFAADVVHAADGWIADMRADPVGQDRCESNYPAIRFQIFNRKPKA